MTVVQNNWLISLVLAVIITQTEMDARDYLLIAAAIVLGLAIA